jgi:hypothetical protein
MVAFLVIAYFKNVGYKWGKNGNDYLNRVQKLHMFGHRCNSHGRPTEIFCKHHYVIGFSVMNSPGNKKLIGNQ